MELSTIKTKTTWVEAAEAINSNNNKIAIAIQSAINNIANSKHKGYFSSASELPNGEEGAIAFVGEWPNYKVYYWSNGSWYNSYQEAYLADYVTTTGNSSIVGSLTVTNGVRSYGFIVAKNADEDYDDGYVILAGGGVKPIDEFQFNEAGNYPKLTAGFAYEILGDSQATSEKFSFRPTGGPNRNVRDGSARIEVLKGNSIVFNQLFKYSNSTSTTTIKGIEFTIGKGKIIANGTATAKAEFGISINSTQGHIYAIVGCPSGGSESTYKFYHESTTLADYGNGAIYTEPRGGVIYNVIQIKSGVTVNNLTFTPRIYDLTQMFGAGNEPTAVWQFYEMLPEGVDINAYNEGEIVDANYKAIKTIGFNQWDEQWEVGSITQEGYNTPSTTMFRSVGYTRILQQKYCVKLSEGQVLGLRFYDENKVHIPSGNLGIVGTINILTPPKNAAYMRFVCTTSNTYNNDICINIAWDEYSALNGTYKPYKPFERDLSWVAKYFPNGMRSAGSVSDEIRFNSTTQQWEAVQRVDVVDLGSLTYDNISARTNTYRCIAYIPTKKIVGINSIAHINITSEFNVNTPDYYWTNDAEGVCDLLNPNQAGIIVGLDKNLTNGSSESIANALKGKQINYALATPDVQTITEDVNLSYDVADYGTEQLIVAEGAQSAPLSAEVVYEPNVLASSKQVAAMLTRLDALEAAMASMQASAVATTNEESYEEDF